MTKRAYSPKEIAAKKWVTLPWGEQWSEPFGFPAENASWFISGASAQGKSSFVMQLGKELCKYGPVLYMSYEERVNQSFQRRMDYLGMNEVQGRFRVVTDDSSVFPSPNPRNSLSWTLIKWHTTISDGLILLLLP